MAPTSTAPTSSTCCAGCSCTSTTRAPRYSRRLTPTLTLTLSLTLALTLTPHPSPSPYQAVLAVLEEAVAVDASVLADEVRAVRERHRSTKLCDALLQRAQEAGAGQLV